MPLPLAMLIWIDPGTTTGLCVFGIRPAWLDGEGSPEWQAMGKAIKVAHFAQVGRDSRVLVDGKAKPVEDGMRVVEPPPERPQRWVERVAPYPAFSDGALLVDQCADLLLKWPRAAWGYESFELSTLAADLSPLRIIAAVTHAELRYGPGRVPWHQTRSQGKVPATNDRLKLAGLYRAGLPDAVDAARHAATFLRRARTDKWLRAEAWPRLFAQ